MPTTKTFRIVIVPNVSDAAIIHLQRLSNTKPSSGVKKIVYERSRTELVHFQAIWTKLGYFINVCDLVSKN